MYWMTLAWIPKGILEKAYFTYFHFLLSGKQDAQLTLWVRWENIAVPKGFGGWGLKNIFLFAKSLAVKGSWRIIQMDNLWTSVMINKYIEPLSLEDWIQKPNKSHAGASIFWKAVIKSFDVIGGRLAWSVKNGIKLSIAKDPWVGCLQQHILRENTILALRESVFFYLH